MPFVRRFRSAKNGSTEQMVPSIISTLEAGYHASLKMTLLHGSANHNAKSMYLCN